MNYDLVWLVFKKSNYVVEKVTIHKFLHDGGLGLYCGLGGEGWWQTWCLGGEGCRVIVCAGLEVSFPEC